MRIIFMGTPDFACPALKKLIESKHEVICVYTQPPKQANRGMNLLKSKVQQLAEENNLKVKTPSSLKDDNEQKEFLSHNSDIAVVAAYGMLLPKEILEGTKFGCINIHPSKLPRWRGAAPIQRTLMAGDSETEVCIMQMDEGLDTGDIILKEKLLLDEDITAGELHDICADIGANLTLKAIEDISNGKIIVSKQSLDGVTYAKKITKNDEKIDFDKPAIEVHNQIRGLSPYPGAFFMLDGKKHKIFKSEVNKEKHTYAAGTIINDKLEIACQEGSIKILEIQKEGKKRVKIEDYINGNKVTIGKTIDN